MLDRAPANLFYLYKYNRERFAFHLYYAALPQNIYNRLLTLLAVREAMLARMSKENNGKGDLSKEVLARAIEICQKYFWGNSAYAVPYCLCRDDYKMVISHGDFEQLVGELPFKNNVRSCPAGTIANAFSDNPIFNEHIDDWEKYNPMKRIVKLRDALRKELNLL